MNNNNSNNKNNKNNNNKLCKECSTIQQTWLSTVIFQAYNFWELCLTFRWHTVKQKQRTSLDVLHKTNSIWALGIAPSVIWVVQNYNVGNETTAWKTLDLCSKYSWFVLSENIHLFVRMHTHGRQRTWAPLAGGVTGAWELPNVGAGNRTHVSARAVWTLNYRSIFPAPLLGSLWLSSIGLAWWDSIIILRTGQAEAKGF